jgi:hypothetical protein
MHRLIMVTQGMMKGQAIQFWYGVLDKDLRHQVRDAMLLLPTQPTLANVFQLLEQIEMNIVDL